MVRGGLVAGDEVDGRFRIVRHLGSGGMGEVYEAWDHARDQAVALKLFRVDTFEREVARERLLREGRALASVMSPFVVRVFEIGAGEPPYVVMELLDGEDLGQRIEREGPLPVAEVEQLARDLSVALIAMHEAGVVHRDLKPKNVFLARGPHGSRVLKVLDFGLAKASFLGAGLTQERHVLGTLNYLSPEQLRCATHADERSDIWAFGAILYEALTGQPAFPGDDAPQVVTAISTLEPTALSELRSDVPPRLAWVVKCALQRNATLRFASAHAVRAALESNDVALPRPDDETRDHTDVVTPRPVARKKPRRAWLAAAMLLGAVGSLLVPTDASRASKRDVLPPVREDTLLASTLDCAAPTACLREQPVVVAAPPTPKPRAQPRARKLPAPVVEVQAAPEPPALEHEEPPARVSHAGELQRSEF